jgi:hypothetical protein
MFWILPSLDSSQQDWGTEIWAMNGAGDFKDEGLKIDTSLTMSG